MLLFFIQNLLPEDRTHGYETFHQLSDSSAPPPYSQITTNIEVVDCLTASSKTLRVAAALKNQTSSKVFSLYFFKNFQENSNLAGFQQNADQSLSSIFFNCSMTIAFHQEHSLMQLFFLKICLLVFKKNTLSETPSVS